MGELSWPVARWRLAQEFKWTLEYVDNLAYGDLLVWYGIQDADQRIQTAQRSKFRKR